MICTMKKIVKLLKAVFSYLVYFEIGVENNLLEPL